jgi:hydrogenase expression/formation protein HypE
MLDAAAGTVEGFRVMRDPTRGGVATVLNEIASRSRVGNGAAGERDSGAGLRCAALARCWGLIPSTSRTKGKLVAMWSRRRSPIRVLAAMQRHPLGAESCRRSARWSSSTPGMVLMKTAVGGTRVVDVLFGEQLPRIC